MKQSYQFLMFGSFGKADEGATFEINLPTVKGFPAKSAKEHKIIRAQCQKGSETILFCEDDFSVRTLTNRILSMSGYKVLSAANGDEALTLAAKYEGPIDILLTDVLMPGMTGKELADKMKAAHPKIKIIYTTGHCSDVLSSRDIDADCDLLRKPFSRKKLLECIRLAMDE